jgi:hypothetical protein
VDEFWGLSWYEWGLYQVRAIRNSENEKFLIENGWNQTRIIWSTVINMWRGKNSKAVKPEDLIELSFDKKPETVELRKKMTDKEMKEKFGSKFKNG